jgi:hypothetical protein
MGIAFQKYICIYTAMELTWPYICFLFLLLEEIVAYLRANWSWNFK